MDSRCNGQFLPASKSSPGGRNGPVGFFPGEPSDLDLHCLLRQGMLCSAREGLIFNVLN